MPAFLIRSSGYYGLILILLIVVSCSTIHAQDRPNILIAVADDATHLYFGAYGAEWIDTPAFDRVAEQGVLFSDAYTPNAKCAPSRAILLTGRDHVLVGKERHDIGRPHDWGYTIRGIVTERYKDYYGN